MPLHPVREVVLLGLVENVADCDVNEVAYVEE